MTYSTYKYKKNEIIKTKNGELLILEQIRIPKKDKKVKSGITNIKGYRYKCLRCGNIEEIDEYNLKSGKGCNVCCVAPKKILEGYNDILTTAPWISEWLFDIRDGHRYTCKSNQPIKFKCKNCGHVKEIVICDFYSQGFSCPHCGDGISYPNKFMFNILEQLDIGFKTEYSPDWIKPKRYDFYIPSLNLIIEMDGGWHNKDNNMSGQTAEESETIDTYKDELARKHSIEVVRINCDYRDISLRKKYLIDSMLTSELKNIFNFQNINWDLADEFSLSSNVKAVCDLWNSGVTSKKELCKRIKASDSAVLSYLKQGKTLGWCNYDEHKQSIKGLAMGSIRNRKQIICINNNMKFSSIRECSDNSMKIFGVDLTHKGISRVCTGERKHYKGFIFNFVKEEEDIED